MQESPIPESMDALALLGPDEFEVREVGVPEAGVGEVLCKVHSVAVCGTDKEIISGNFLKRGWPRGYPYTPGHEWSGEVVALGEGVEGFGSMSATAWPEPPIAAAGTAGCVPSAATPFVRTTATRSAVIATTATTAPGPFASSTTPLSSRCSRFQTR